MTDLGYGIADEYANRNTLAGFTKYWSKNRLHFADLYGIEFGKREVLLAYRECRALRDMLLYRDIGAITD